MQLLHVFGPAGPRCTASVRIGASIAEVHAVIEAETGIPPDEQSLFHGLDQLLYDSSIAALGASDSVSLLLVQCSGHEHRIRFFMNHARPDNFETIVTQLSQIDVQSAEELDAISRIIVEKALADPLLCETYADMIYALCGRLPEFPTERAGAPVHDFRRSLLNTLQDEFESSEERDKLHRSGIAGMENEGERMLACVKLVGNLFLRRMLHWKMIGNVAFELIGAAQSPPPREQDIKCACVLLRVAGCRMDAKQQAREHMGRIAQRLQQIQTADVDGRASISSRLQFQIQHLLDLRQSGWQDKKFP